MRNPEHDRREYLAQALDLLHNCKGIKNQDELKRFKDKIVHLFVLSWPSPIVCRCEIETFSGGLLKSGTMANRDSAGCGIRPIIRANGKVTYFTANAAEYIVKLILG